MRVTIEVNGVERTAEVEPRHLLVRFLRDDLYDTAARLAAEGCDPQSDQRGPADYKRHLAGELTRRALKRAVARARGEGG